jgi:hypothetical protein
MAKKTHDEKPIRVVQNWKRKVPKKWARVFREEGPRHRTETRVFAREIAETYCVHPRCKFRGQRAAQGVCFSTKTFAEGTDWNYFWAMEKAAKRYLEEVRRIYRREGKAEYIRALEGSLTSDWLNSILHADEMIYLRREVALLRLKLARRRRAR